MDTMQQKINYNPSRDLYWAKIDLKSKATKKQTSIFVCASYEYLRDKVNLKTNTGNKELGSWYTNVFDEWKNKGERIFQKQNHYDIRTITAQGEQSSLEFLESEVR